MLFWAAVGDVRMVHGRLGVVVGLAVRVVDAMGWGVATRGAGLHRLSSVVLGGVVAEIMAAVWV